MISLWLVLIALFSPKLGAGELAVAFGKDGLESVKIAGQEMIADGAVVVKKVVLSETGSSPLEADDPYAGETRAFSEGEIQPAESAFDAAKSELVQTFSWGRLAVRYAAQGQRLTMTVELDNTGTKTMEMLQAELLRIMLPGEKVVPRAVGSEPKWARDYTNIGTPLIVAATFENGKAVLASTAPGGPLQYGLKKQGKAEAPFGVTVTLGEKNGGKELYDGVWLARPVAPGESDAFTLGLRFGDAEANVLAMAEDVTKAFAKKHPFTLEWPDRRPIGAIHVADARNSSANPRGWKHGVSVPKKWDIRTDEGYKAFHDGVMKGAEKTIRTARLAGMQGVIVWQIEGQEFKKAAYYGEPRLLPYIAPEMEGIADAYFKALRDAGLRVGICIRPLIFAPLDGEGKVTSWKKVVKIKPRNWVDPEKDVAYQAPDNFFGREEAASPVERLDAKIRYARERWDCTLFYVDTNHFWRPRDKSREKWGWANKMLPSKVFEELHRRHPDILLVPEHEYLQYWSASAPYRQPPQYGGITPSLVDAVYPHAFSLLTIQPGHEHFKANYERYLDGIGNGDILMVNGWYGGKDVASFYHDAALHAPWRLHLAADEEMTFGRQPTPPAAGEAGEDAEGKTLPVMSKTMPIANLDALSQTVNEHMKNLESVAERGVSITWEKAPEPARLNAIIDRIGKAGGIIRSTRGIE